MVHIETEAVADGCTVFVAPGDTVEVAVLKLDSGKEPELRIGPGLQVVTDAQLREGDSTSDSSVMLQVVVSGDLRRKANTVWIDGVHKRALPAEDDYVVGIITGSPGENYNVDIGGSSNATLHNLAFEGATKRNRPRLKAGDLVYARVQLMHKYMEPELTCVHGSGKAQGMGQLEGGFLFECSLSLCRQLLSRGCHVLHALGAEVPFEITIGRNGRVWVKAQRTSQTMMVCNAIKASERLSPKQTRALVKELVKKMGNS